VKNIGQTPGARIVPATETDLADLSNLAGTIWRTYYPGIISREQIEYMLAKMYSLETLREEICRRGIRYERLLVGESFAGFAAYGPTEQPAVFKLHKIYMHPEWHGRGLGSLLLRHCEGQAAKAGGNSLVLTVNKKNTKAIAAYLRNGFVVTDAVVTDIGGGFVMDDYIMSKNIFG
jgi:ribosomal protein S18 acetylase RimI-like enzyme